LKRKELLAVSAKIISGKMKRDGFNRLFGRILYWQSKKQMTEEDLQTLQDVFYKNGIYAEAEFDDKRFFIRVRKHKDVFHRPHYFLHSFLFILTVFTTSATGALLQGKNPFGSFEELSSGFPYSFSLLAILFAHEMGHYISARIHRVQVSLPYFIPFFLPVFHPGTLGAFIKIRSAIPNKRALFDIGIAGPIAGFILSIFFIVYGYYTLPDAAGIFAYIKDIHPVEDEGNLNLTMGTTLLFSYISDLFNGQRLPMNEMYHFPYIFSGWFGLLVTSINLMPIGQLDGGHITYALFGKPSKALAIIAFILLVGLNVYLIIFFQSYVWVLWSLLILFLIRFKHPPTQNDAEGVGPFRQFLGWLSYGIFIISFSPMPIFIP